MSDSIFLTGTFNKSEQLAVEAFYDRRFPTVVMLILFSIVGIPGNIIVLLVYFKGRLTSTQFLISVIAMVDLLSAGVAIPLNIVYQTTWFSILDITFCRIVKVTAFVATYPGVYLIWGLSVVRYYHVCRPHKLYFVEKKIKAFCVFVFGISLFFGGYIYILMGKQTWVEKELPAYYCSVADDYKNGIAHVFLFGYFVLVLNFCLISIVIMYYKILTRVLKHQKVMNTYKNNTSNKCEQLLANELESKTNVVFTDQPGVSTISHDKSSVTSHTSYRSNKQSNESMEVIENVVETSPNRRNSRRKIKKIQRKKSMTNKTIDVYRTTLKVAIVGTVYVLTYVPWAFINTYLLVHKLPRAQFQDLFKYVFNPGQYLCYLGCAVNPVIYFVDPIFRSKCKAIFLKTKCVRRLHK